MKEMDLTQILEVLKGHEGDCIFFFLVGSHLIAGERKITDLYFRMIIVVLNDKFVDIKTQS
jgi:hypothetical protein